MDSTSNNSIDSSSGEITENKKEQGFIHKILSPIKSLFRKSHTQIFNPILYLSTASANIDDGLDASSSFNTSLLEVEPNSNYNDKILSMEDRIKLAFELDDVGTFRKGISI
jgi:hypothetical protein